MLHSFRTPQSCQDRRRVVPNVKIKGENTMQMRFDEGQPSQVDKELGENLALLTSSLWLSHPHLWCK